MTMLTIRKYRRVPAKRGGRIIYTGGKDGKPVLGTIRSARGGYLRIELDTGGIKSFHPTWELIYLDQTPSVNEINSELFDLIDELETQDLDGDEIEFNNSEIRRLEDLRRILNEANGEREKV